MRQYACKSHVLRIKIQKYRIGYGLYTGWCFAMYKSKIYGSTTSSAESMKINRML